MLQYLLDTNILLAYLRQGSLEAYLQAVYFAFLTLPPIISIVTEAEIKVIARINHWGKPKLDTLQTRLEYLTIIPITYPAVLEAYVELDVYSRTHKPAIKMGKNDLWIAATAHATGATLLTTDKDFDHLHPNFISREYVDPRSHL